jgi:multidrug efflux pump subunit AcrA (membrane-fusion protein)
MSVLAVAGCNPAPAEEVEPTPTPFPTPVRPMFTVRRGDITRTATLAGRIAPVTSRELFFAMNGSVGKVYVEVNDAVEEGQLLADLVELGDLQAEWAAASEVAEQEALKNRHVIRRAEIEVEIAQLTLDLYRSQGRSPFEIRIQELEVERAQMALDEIEADPALHAADAKVNELEAKLAKAQLVSPVAGVVIAAVNEGRNVRTTTAAFVIGDTRNLEVSANAETDVLKEMTEGMDVTITLDGQPGRVLTGTVRRLPYPYGSGESGSPDDTVRIRLHDSPAQGNYAINDRVQVEVVLAQKTGALWLPLEAVREAGGRTFVIVQTESGPRQVNVAVGVRTLDRIEIVEGLSEGQVVIGP